MEATVKLSNKKWSSSILQFDTINNHLTAEELAIEIMA